jgi:hypothetical protein
VKAAIAGKFLCDFSLIFLILVHIFDDCQLFLQL